MVVFVEYLEGLRLEIKVQTIVRFQLFPHSRDLTGLKRLLFQRILILVQSHDSLLTTCAVLYYADVRLFVCSSHGGNECKRVVRKSVPLNL